MTTVTISRDFGSEGDLLARKIANNLGYQDSGLNSTPNAINGVT